jgi:hypothetical protein
MKAMKRLCCSEGPHSGSGDATLREVFHGSKRSRKILHGAGEKRRSIAMLWDGLHPIDSSWINQTDHEFCF